MKNDGGIFIFTVLTKILDSLIYQDNYDEIDNSMSDSNTGGRKNRSTKNHLFIIYRLINYIVKGNGDPIEIQIYNLEQAFDAM